MIRVTGPSPCPPASSFTYFTVQGLLLEQQIQTQMSIISLESAGLLFALLLNLYFGFRTSTGTPGKENEPLIGEDVSTLSPYGARNSTELLSNLHNMLGI